MLALSSRQLERKDGSFPASMSLMLYQQAIHKLLPELHTKDVSVVASCVVLCVLEMLSCKYYISKEVAKFQTEPFRLTKSVATAS